MGVSFLTPWAGLFALAAVIPLAALWVLERRGRVVRKALATPDPGRRSWMPIAVAISSLGALLALAVAQPVLVLHQARRERTDAEAYVVVDTSRSMSASVGASGTTRFERARNIAGELRSRLADIPVGLASLTDRTLPNVFPTTDQTTYRASLARSIGVDRPPPAGYERVGTSFDALATLQTTGFFDPSASKRLAIVLTDGESRPIVLRRLVTVLGRPPAVTPVFVHVWHSGERLYDAGVLDPQYAADPTSSGFLRQLAAATGGRVFDEDNVNAVVRAARGVLGKGETSALPAGSRRIALTSWLLLAAGLPLGYLLLRRNL